MAIKIKSITESTVEDTYDIHNFDESVDQGNFVIDGLVVHNSILSNGVRNFNDLMLLNAMGHPGPMQSIPEAMENRDDTHARWKLRLHPEIAEILKDTYGVIVYQEQLQALWQRLAGFTAPEAQEARKAVAKKWTHKLKPIKQKWIDGSTKILGAAEAEEYWSKMESFGRYAFNKCLSKDTLLKDQVTGETKAIEEWKSSNEFPVLYSYCDEQICLDECVAIHDTGLQEVWLITFDNGQTEMVTAEHKFLCSDGEFHEVREIIDKGLDVLEVKDCRLVYT